MKLGGYQWIMLDKEIGLITTKYIVADLPFDKGNSNNWETSTLKKWLNNEFLTAFSKEELSKISGEVRLLTKEEINSCKYKDVIIDRSYWLMTPYSGKSTVVRIVYSDGAVSSRSASNAIGVRPVLVLKKNTNKKEKQELIDKAVTSIDSFSIIGAKTSSYIKITKDFFYIDNIPKELTVEGLGYLIKELKEAEELKKKILE